MSFENPIDLRQDRRQWLKSSATMLGATLLPATALSTEQAQAETQVQAESAAKTTAHDTVNTGHFLTPTQHTLVEELSETIIPADSHSGGAKAAKVADTIDRYLAGTYDESEKALWREGLQLIDLMSEHYNGKTFVNAPPEARVAVLTVLSENSQMNDLPEVKFFTSLKRLTVLAYYTSKIGIHDELEYKGNRVLKEYVGCDDQEAAKS